MSNGLSRAEALQRSGDAADATFPSQPPGSATRSCKQKTWTEVRLVDQEGKPVADEAFELVLPDRSVVTGKTDSNGLAGVEGIDPNECEIHFPELRASTTAVKG